VVGEGGERCWEIEGGLLRGLLRQLMEERSQKVRVVNLDWQLDEDILVS
jgi:hypothetical protein